MQCLPQATSTLGKHYCILAPWGESNIFPWGILSPREDVSVSVGKCITTQRGVTCPSGWHNSFRSGPTLGSPLVWHHGGVKRYQVNMLGFNSPVHQMGSGQEAMNTDPRGFWVEPRGELNVHLICEGVGIGFFQAHTLKQKGELGVLPSSHLELLVFTQGEQLGVAPRWTKLRKCGQPTT